MENRSAILNKTSCGAKLFKVEWLSLSQTRWVRMMSNDPWSVLKDMMDLCGDIGIFEMSERDELIR